MIVIQLLLVNPSTSETPEPYFSLEVVWSKPGQDHQRNSYNLMQWQFLHANKNLTDQLDLVDVGNDFVSLSEIRSQLIDQICAIRTFAAIAELTVSFFWFNFCLYKWLDIMYFYISFSQASCCEVCLYFIILAIPEY